MKVTVVIPVYNEEKYIKSCLDSLMVQQVKPDEIIVVDNNCTDQTVKIVQSYPKVKILQEKKQGITYARNAGFNAAKGDIIARCDADAIVPTNWIKRIKKDFTEKSNIVALTTHFDIFDTPLIGNTLLTSKIYFNTAELFLKNPTLVGFSMAVKKIYWDKVKNEICTDDTKVHEDIDLSIHIAKYGKIYLDRSLTVKMSGRRIKYNPLSFFLEYPARLISMLNSHRHLL